MPPKRTSSNRGRGRRTTATAPAEAPASDDDAKPYVEPSSSEQLLPSASVPAQPDPSSSIAPPVSTSKTSFLPVSGSSTTRGQKPQNQPKFSRRPRRERQELQKAEEDRKKAEEAKAAAEASKAQREGKRRDDGGNRGRGRGDAGRGGARGRGRGRGRGGYMGESERDPKDRVASGPFGAGQSNKVHRATTRRGTVRRAERYTRGRVARTGRQDDADGQFSSPLNTASPARTEDGKEVKQEPGPSTAVQDVNGDISMVDRPHAVVIGDGGYISSDEDEGEKGVQRMNVEDLNFIDLTQDEIDYDSFAPVRVQRVQHKERTLGINADGATNQEGAITIDANDTTTIVPSERRKGKQKAKDIEVINENKTFQATYSDSDSDLVSQTKIKREVDKQTQEPGSDLLKEPPSSPEAKRKAKEKIKGDIDTTARSDNQVQDEFEESHRHQKDLNILREELGALSPAGLDEDGDTSMTADDKRAEKVYLFQFPPVLPDLLPIIVKPDPEATNNEPEATRDDQPIIIEDDSKSQGPKQPQLPSGAVGKLKVHASGRVTLDWGGTSFCLGMGTEASFLQDILVAELPDVKKDDSESTQSGVAISMGQVKGKFVVTPDWDQILK